MSELMRRICLLSCFFGTAVSLIPEKGTKQIAQILCTCILVICILEPFSSFNWTAFSTELALYRENERKLTENTERTRQALNRAVIEEEYTSYIFDIAEKRGVIPEKVKVEVIWSDEGIWIPEGTYIECKETGADIDTLSGQIEAELGIPKERQQWEY